ncbi:ABC transporter permease, partial [Acidobacteria bacterium AH-259-G07]|nr:ABC transporter permease [Acidobacteria bacterium AH-259-G07]
MLYEVLRLAWEALRRQPLRSFLTMLGITWGIVAVTLLIAYGSSFRGVLMDGFNAFGKSAVVCWPGQTSDQAGGERAGKRVRLEKIDLENILQEATLVKQASLETMRRLAITY